MSLARRVVAAIVVAACVATAVVAGCERDASGRVDARRQPALRVATVDRPRALDPAVADTAGARALVGNVYQTLLTIPAGQTKPAPDAADCQFDTPTEYRCTVRTGLVFHNGHRLDPVDVKFSLDRLRTVVGAGSAAAMFASVRGIETRGDDTVVFTLRRPDATLPYALTTPAASIVDSEVYPAGRALAATAAVGSGPYQLARFPDTGPVVLERYARYRGVQKVRSPRVEISYVADDGLALLDAFLRGRADVAIGSDLASQVPQGMQSAAVDTGSIGLWTFDLRAPSGRQLAVRRAVAQLLDREQLVRTVYEGRVRPLHSVLPADFDGAVPAFADSYGASNRTRAAAVLRAAGVRTPVPLVVGWNPSRFGPSAGPEAKELRRQLEHSRLFAVTLRRADGPGARPLAEHHGFDLSQHVHTADVPDGDSFVRPLLWPGGHPPANGYVSAAVTRLLTQEASGQRQGEREAALAGLQRQIAADVPVLPVWQRRVAVVARPDVSGLDQLLDRMSGVRYAVLDTRH